MRLAVGVLGGGLAGSLLAWRLAVAGAADVTLLAGPPPEADATDASGGLVRGFETDPEACRLAVASLAELLADPALRDWAGYRETGSAYLCPPGFDPAPLVAAVEERVPGSAAVAAPGPEWARLPDGCVAVTERRAGNISPARLRRHVLADLRRRGTRVVEDTAAPPRPAEDGVSCRAGGADHRFDALVVAAGRWTGALLAAAGLPAPAVRTKLIQYAVYETEGARPPAFIDDTSGLYGRPDGDRQLLLGVPSEEWDVDPNHPRPDVRLAHRAAELAAVRLPGLRLVRRERLVAAADCYTDPPGLALRPAAPVAGRLHTFTGGSGGAAKTALAASREAADLLMAELRTHRGDT